ncbi:hypothetical protein BG003_011136 [Podila horticola]|nr:hypothetical protein BG003_011136 [Podila horticola]
MTITIIHQAPAPSEVKIRHTQPNVTLHVTPVSTRVQNPGTLYIADECLYFFSALSNSGFSIPYPSIIIHAIARESSVGPSIYCQLEGSLSGTEPDSNGKKADDEEEEEEEDSVLEMTFVPGDVSSLDTIYENLSYCASLHQDENDDDYMDEDDIYQDDEDDHEGLYADADIQGGYIPRSSSTTAIGHQADNDSTTEVPAIDLQSGEWFTGNAETDAAFELSEQGQANLARMESMVQDPQGLIKNNGVPAPEEEEPGQDAEEDRFKSVDV